MTGDDMLEVAAWRLAVGGLASDDLPEMATEAIVRGIDSPSLRLLAGQPRNDVRDSADLFIAALDELGIEVLDPDRAQWKLAWRTAGDIVAGRVRPGSASELWSAYERVRDNGDLRIFVGLASMLEDHPDDAERSEADIVLAARELLARPAPRRWIKLMALRGRAPVTQTVGPDDIEVDLDALYLSGGLRSDLARWNARFEAVLAEWPVQHSARDTTSRPPSEGSWASTGGDMTHLDARVVGGRDLSCPCPCRGGSPGTGV